jgi:hypothetical protein
MLNPEYQNWLANLCVALSTLLLVMATVLIHYEGLSTLNRWLYQVKTSQHRRLVLYTIGSVIALHTLEIWVFGLSYHGLLHWPEMGAIRGARYSHVFDAIYFSATSFTSLGYGDLIPTGPIRFMAGTEGLVGLVLIGWSASFTYLEMQRYWPTRK